MHFILKNESINIPILHSWDDYFYFNRHKLRHRLNNVNKNKKKISFIDLKCISWNK